MKLKELADKLGARLDPPDADAEISSVGSIESAIPGQITFAVSSKFCRWPKPARHPPLSSTKNFLLWISQPCGPRIPNLLMRVP